MASSAAQLIGYVLALIGLSATIAATFMVEWKRVSPKQGDGLSRVEEYLGLWRSCSIARSGNYACEPYESFINQRVEVQATRAIMLLSALFSICGVLVATVGLKCTNCLNSNKQAKNSATMAGGISFMIAGSLALSVTSWFASNIVQSFDNENQDRFEFGSALFVSWTGSILSLLGGAFLACRCPKPSMRSSIKSPKFQPASITGTDYV